LLQTAGQIQQENYKNWKNRSIKELLGGRGTKGICKERGRKTKTKHKDYVIHDQAG
jgi:hypothetical protein